MTAGLPSPAELLAWSTDHLTAGAAYWDAYADRSENAVIDAWQLVHTIGWEGQAAEAGQARTAADKTKVRSEVAGRLRDAATVARQGASDVTEAHKGFQYSIENAWDAGFNVYDGYDVVYAGTTATEAERAVRQAQAQAFAVDIRQRAVELFTLDQQVGANVQNAVAAVGAVTFPEYKKSTGPRRNGVQLAGYGIKEDGGDQPAPQPQPQGQPQIGPFPVPPQVAAAAPAQLPPPVVPPPPPVPKPPPGPSLGQCVQQKFDDNIGENMVKDGFKSAVETAIKGAITGGLGGAAVTPEAAGAGAVPGALGLGVLGFVGGFAKGLIEAPIKTLGEAAMDCAK